MLFKAEKERQQQIAEKEAKDKKNNKQAVNNQTNKDKNKPQEQEQLESYVHDDEMKNALKLEKAKFRCRISLLRQWGINNLKNIRNAIYPLI